MTREPDVRHAQLLEWLSVHVQLIRRISGRAGDRLYCCTEELVLTVGRWGLPAPLLSGRARGPERRCFVNAFRYSEKYRVTYVEGYALTDFGFTCPHAWCVDDHGYVHDPTWPDAGAAYLGIPLSPRYIKLFRNTYGNTSLLHDAPRDTYALLREGLPNDAIVPIGDPVATPA